MDTSFTNPFVRGFTSLSSRRVVLIFDAEDQAAYYRPLHSSQGHLLDRELSRCACLFNDEFVLITEGQTLIDELISQCPSHGVTASAFYEVIADQDGKLYHIGDLPSAEAAKDVITQLRFETGHYSRSWEISARHLPCREWRQLREFAREPSIPLGLNFECFTVPVSGAIGIKLYSTPWSDKHLQDIEGPDQATLKAQQLAAGMPEVLVSVLSMAGLADVRFLVFDPDAPVLAGLRTYEYR